MYIYGMCSIMLSITVCAMKACKIHEEMKIITQNLWWHCTNASLVFGSAKDEGTCGVRHATAHSCRVSGALCGQEIQQRIHLHLLSG